MKRLLLFTTLLAACDDHAYRDLIAMGALTGSVNIDVGVPEQPGSGDNYGTGMSFDLTYSAVGCYTLDGSAQGALDGHGAEYFVAGGMESYDVHGTNETTCVTPSFYLDTLPPAQALSVITLTDDSTELSMGVDRLLVNPRLEIGGLTHGTDGIVRIEDDRPIARATVWWRGEFDDPDRQDWYAEPTIGGGEIRFAVPATARGTGVLGIEITIEDHQVDCVGFTSCEVTTRGGASFMRTIQ